jgi:hypothetical protein
MDPAAMSQEIQNRIVGIIGRKGEGKSTELENLLLSRDRIIIVDPNGEHDWSPNELDNLDQLREFVKWSGKRKLWAANFVPGEDIEEDVSEASRIIFNSCHDCAVAFDEITEYCSAGYAPKPFSRLVRRGRHKELDIFYTSLRFAETPRRLTAQTDKFILFQQAEPSDLDGIAKRCGPDVADRVAGLGKHEKLVWEVSARKLVDSPLKVVALHEKSA